MIGGFNIEPDEWYHKLWFYPLCLVLLVALTCWETAKELKQKIQRKE